MSMWHPARKLTLQEFIEQYRALPANERTTENATDALFGSMSNAKVRDRVGIASFLLTEGADPANIEAGGDRVNVLHALLSHRRGQERDFAVEAPLLQRLLDGGADINQRSPRFGYPVDGLPDLELFDGDITPFLDVVFSRPELDLSVYKNKTMGVTMADYFTRLPESSAIPQRAKQFLEHGPSPRPEFPTTGAREA